MRWGIDNKVYLFVILIGEVNVFILTKKENFQIDHVQTKITVDTLKILTKNGLKRIIGWDWRKQEEGNPQV